VEIEFHGAAREVTGSCHILRANGHTILLDCGMFQGSRRESASKNRQLPLPVADIDAVVLSHAHIDHAGRLPFLVAQGYDRTIWATAATRDLCAIMLADSAHIQEKDAETLDRRHQPHDPPLYGMEDATRTMELMVGVPYEQWFDVVPGVKASYVDAGHILGSASVLVDVTENGSTKRLVFSGDIGRWGLEIIRDPQPPVGARVVIMESTYGNRDHGSVDGARELLAKTVRETAARGGKILIPAFAVGRTQELVYDLNQLARDGRVPDIPIYIDSPLATDATTVFEMHPEVFDRTEDLIRITDQLFRFKSVRYTPSVEDSRALNTAVGPMIIIAASGMAESGRILHHLANHASDPRNTVLVVGFMAEHTLGRRIVERRSVIKVFGEEIALRAEVVVLDGYSAHADRTELRRWIDALRAGSPDLEHVWLVHGEPDAQDTFAATLRAAGYTVDCPDPGAKYQI
jgi:metallo-beta-lactamase family protein